MSDDFKIKVGKHEPARVAQIEVDTFVFFLGASDVRTRTVQWADIQDLTDWTPKV